MITTRLALIPGLLLTLGGCMTNATVEMTKTPTSNATLVFIRARNSGVRIIFWTSIILNVRMGMAVKSTSRIITA